jgi:hypothetical protein
VPVTGTYRAELLSTGTVAMCHLYRRFPGAFQGRVLYFASPRRDEFAPDGLDVGGMSGFNLTEQSPLVQAVYAWPYALFLVKDLEARAYVALLEALCGDVSFITGVFPLAIVVLLRRLVADGDRLVHDLARGTLDGAPGLTADERAFFGRRARPRPDLARRLEAALRLPEDQIAAAAFPLLRLVYCWNTATAALYLPELRRRLGPDVAIRDAIFAASEAWCNVPMGTQTPGGPLAVNVCYFEFIEEEDYNRGSRATLPLAGLVVGKRYHVVTSNETGYYRYLLGDVVEVTGYHHRTPCVHFVRREGAKSNLAGELLDESHVNLAVAGAIARAGLDVTYFALVANVTGALPGYDLHLEGPTDALASLLADVEAALGQLAVNYADCLAKGLLRPLKARPLAPGSYDAWKRRRLAKGGGEAQLKAVHLVSDAGQLAVELGGRD